MTIKTNPTLARYTHAAPESAAENLARRITQLRLMGLDVIHAISARTAVPNAYKGAYKVAAPSYVYRDGEIRLVDMPLETRPFGGEIPAHYTIKGDIGGETPLGWRCLSRTEHATELVH